MTFEGGVTALARRIRDQFNKIRPVVGTIPLAPFEGQIWFDSTNDRAWIRVGTDWLPFQPQAAVSSTEPPLSAIGDLWVKPDLTLWFYNGIDFQEVRPSAASVPRCRATQGSVQSIPNGASTAMVLDGTEFYDTNGMHSPTSNPTRVQLPRVGAWSVTGRVGFAANASGRRIAMIAKNGSEEARNAVSPNAATTIQSSVTETIESDGNDYVEVWGYHQITGGGPLNSDFNYTSLSATYLGT